MVWNPKIAFNELPNLPPDDHLETKAVMTATIEARAALAAFKQATRMVPNRDVLGLFTALEAKSSSNIENVITTVDRLFLFSDNSATADSQTKETLRNKRALVKGAEHVRVRPLSPSLFSDLCSELRGATVVVRKMPGTRITNPVLKKIIYTPPDNEKTILEKLDNLAAYLNTPDNDTDPLIKMAIAHYQFEAIHPFSDGNGRTGRLINQLYLVDQGLLDVPCLPVSRFIMENRTAYYEKLLAVTKERKWEEWILYMLDAVGKSADWATQKILAIGDMEKDLTDYMASVPELTKFCSQAFVGELFARPYCRIRNMMDKHLGSRITVTGRLRKMCRHHLLTEITVWKEKLFVNKRLLDLLESPNHYFERLADRENPT